MIIIKCPVCDEIYDVEEDWQNCPCCGINYAENNINIVQKIKRNEEYREYRRSVSMKFLFVTDLVAIGIYSALVFLRVLDTKILGITAILTIMIWAIVNIISVRFVVNFFAKPKFPDLYKLNQEIK